MGFFDNKWCKARSLGYSGGSWGILRCYSWAGWVS